MSGKKLRREHYVPRLYLRQFGDRLFGFDKTIGRIFPTTGNGIAVEEGFYDLNAEIDLEDLISKNENNLKDGLHELTEKRNPTAISDEARIKLSLFIALQFVRTREHREMIRELCEKFYNTILENDPAFKGKGIKVSMKEEPAKALQATEIVGDVVPMIAWILGHFKWTLLVNNTKIPFWTSDNPVAQYNPVDYGDLSGLGFIVRGIQTHFPVNPQLQLVILDPTTYDEPPIILVKQDSGVLFENELQLYNASRFVFSPKEDFSEASKLREKDETLRSRQHRIIIRSLPGGNASVIQISRSMLKRK